MMRKNILLAPPLQPSPPLPVGGRAMGEGTGVRFREGGLQCYRLRAMLARTSFLLVLAVAFLLGLAPVVSHSLWTPDEPTGAGIGRAMAESGDWIVPRLNGKPFLEKPPLYWWALAGSLRLLGMSDTAARVPSALFTVLTLLVVWVAGIRLGGPREGL